MVNPAVWALCNRLAPSAALRQAEAKFSHCGVAGRANGLALISVVVLSALRMASAIGSSDTNSASPMSTRANVLLDRASVIWSGTAAALQSEIDRRRAKSEQTHHAGNRRRLADIAIEEGVTVGQRRKHLAAVGRTAPRHNKN